MPYDPWSQPQFAAPYIPPMPGPSTGDYVSGALNLGSLLFPPLAVPSLLWNLGRGIDQGSSGENYSAPEVAGSQTAGNMLYGGGASGWLGRQIGGLFSPSEQTVAPSFAGPQQQTAPMGTPIQARNIQPDMGAAMKSLMSAYQPSWYDTSGGGWKAGTGDGQATAQTGYKGDITPAQSGGSTPWTPWYAGQQDPFQGTQNMATTPWAGDFGSGRFAYGDGLANSISGGQGRYEYVPSWGPGARFNSDPNATD